MLANGLILGCGVLTGVLAARLLQPQGRGALAAVIFWPQLVASLGTLSFNEAATYQIGRSPDDADTVAASAIRLGAGLSVLTAVITVLMLPILMGPARQNWWLLASVYAAVFIPANMLSRAVLSWEQGRLRFSAYNGFRLAGPVLYLAGLLALWLADLITVGHVVLVSLAAVSTVSVVQLARARSLVRLKVSRDAIQRLFRQGLSFHGATALMILSVQADRIVVLAVFDDVTIGYYVVAFAVASLGLAAIGMAFHTVLLPVLSRSSADQRVDLFARGLRAAMLILVATTLVIALAAPTLIVVLFGLAYAPAGGLATLLSLALCLVALRNVAVLSLRGLGDARGGLVAELISLVTFTLVCVPLALHLGPRGMALAITIAAMPSLAFLVYHLKTTYDLPAASMWGLRPATVGECLSAARSLRHR